MDADRAQGSGSGHPGTREQSKRRRLNFACNYCRNRKTRCDEQQPSCQACISAGVPCVTEDRRRPGQRIKRREAGKATTSSSLGSASPFGDGPPSACPGTTGTSPSPQPNTDLPSTSMTNEQSKIDNPLPIWRQSTGATSFELLTEWLDLAFYRLNIMCRVNLSLSSGSEGGTNAPAQGRGLLTGHSPQTIPSIPDTGDVPALFDAFEREIHIFFPVLRLDVVRTEVMHAASSPFLTVDAHLLRTYLLLSIGACILQKAEWKDFIKQTLTLARNCLGNLIGTATLDPEEILFLSSVCLRLSDEITAAWTTLGICTSVACCMGLNRPGKRKTSMQNSVDDERRRSVWWAIYSYEKLFSFQLGYISNIMDESSDRLDSKTIYQTQDYILSMAKVFSMVSRRCVEARRQEDLANKNTLEAAIKEKVNATGESFLMLSRWADSLPVNLRPTSDLMPPSAELPLASFISLHYHNAVLMLSRNSLLISKDALYKAVEVMAKGTAWEHAIRSGQSMTISSARKIIHVLAEMEASQPPSLAPLYHASLHAFYILAIQILKQPPCASLESTKAF
ncbi:transcription factor [Fusarium albosuccineum]|uniref:Transcription factor n=1 Tax=Fusarium albosuccineum TaxID=1237068 RepID=A0A8H4P985_9HYPO|nr:transcription factor [Fusarium albosuccineum]